MTDVAFDTETTGFNWYDNDRPFLLQAADQQRPAGFIQHTALTGHRSSDGHDVEVALGRATRVVGHNLPFDIHMARAGQRVDLLGDVRARNLKVADTLHLARIVAPERRTFAKEDEDDPRRGYKLADLATTFVDQDAKDSEKVLEELAEKHGFKLKAKPGQTGYVEQAYFELWKHEPEAMEFYGREDVRLTLALVSKLESLLDEGPRRVWELEQAVMPWVVSAERRGVAIDREKVIPLKIQYQDEVDRLSVILDEALGEGWDDNNEQLAVGLVRAGVPLEEMTDGGKQLATNKWALERFVDDYPIIAQIQELRTYRRFLNTYIEAVEGRDVVHPHFWQIGTWTGRMASSNPNMQNIPVRSSKDVRALFIPRPGYGFMAMDYEQIEFRLLAYYLHNKPLIDLMESGHDPFAWLAARVHGGEMDYYRKGQPGESARSDCKNTTYAVQYGAGGKRIQRMLHLPTEADGRAYAKLIKDNLPGYKRLARRIEKQVYGPALDRELRALPFGRPDWREQREAVINRYMEETGRTYGVVNTIMGRRQTIPLLKAYTGMSGLIQGGAADIFKQGVINACEAVKHLGAEPVLFVHDELVLEVPLEHMAEVQPLALDGLRNAYDLHPRLEVEVGVGVNDFSECK